MGILDFDSLFINENYDTRQFKSTVIVSLEQKLTKLWKTLLKSNIDSVELDTNYQITNSSEKSILLLSYNMKLDKRVVDDPTTIMKLAQLINMTLLEPNSIIYLNLTDNLNSSLSFIMPEFLITRKINIFIGLVYFPVEKNEINFLHGEYRDERFIFNN